MPTSKRQQRRPATAKNSHPTVRKGRLRAPAVRSQAPPRPSRSRAMQLAAEVERLEQELAAARAQMAALAARAEIDPITDIVNRHGFERELKRACAYVKRYGASAALIYLDLDGFKCVNDGYGHAAGDAVLKAVAMVINRHVRACDLAARVGGDEFAVLLWHCNEADANAKALALETAIARMTATFAGACVSVGASAGVAMLLPLDQPADVVGRADRAMYARKRCGPAAVAE
jgi:diguanylate cyclase (GGDEF)-like protein